MKNLSLPVNPGLYGKDGQEAARVDMVNDGLEDLARHVFRLLLLRSVRGGCRPVPSRVVRKGKSLYLAWLHISLGGGGSFLSTGGGHDPVPEGASTAPEAI